MVTLASAFRKPSLRLKLNHFNTISTCLQSSESQSKNSSNGNQNNICDSNWVTSQLVEQVNMRSQVSGWLSLVGKSHWVTFPSSQKSLGDFLWLVKVLSVLYTGRHLTWKPPAPRHLAWERPTPLTLKVLCCGTYNQNWSNSRKKIVNQKFGRQCNSPVCVKLKSVWYN